MSCIDISGVFSSAPSAANAATDTLSSGVLAGGDIGAGVLSGTLPTGLDQVGSIIPEIASTTGSLAGGVSGLLGGGADVAGGLSPALTGAPGSAVAPTPAIAPVAGAPTPGISAALGSPQSGALGGAAASAAPVSTPLSPTATGTFGSGVSDTNLVGMEDTRGGAASALPRQVSVDTGAVDNPAGGRGLSSMSLSDAGTSATAAPVAPTAPGATTSIDRFMADPSLKTGLGALSANSNLVLPAAGMAATLLTSQPNVSGRLANTASAALERTAAQLGTQSQALQNYLQTGTLPPGVQAGLTSAGQAAKATIRSRHAASGTSGSSAEGQELAAVDQQMTTQGAGIAMNLLQTGLSESQMSSQLYQTILGNALQEDQALGQAIGRFSSALAGGGQTINLRAA